jgi:hypothetical protein
LIKAAAEHVRAYDEGDHEAEMHECMVSCCSPEADGEAEELSPSLYRDRATPKAKSFELRQPGLGATLATRELATGSTRPALPDTRLVQRGLETSDRRKQGVAGQIV